MTLYRFEVVRNLFDTGVQSRADIRYFKPDGTPWPISTIDYDLLNALNAGCIGRTFIADGDLDDRARNAALSAIQTVLNELNEPLSGWDVIVNASQPSGGVWDDTSTDRWVHFTKVVSGEDGITASPYAELADGDVVTTWRVPSIKAVIDAG